MRRARVSDSRKRPRLPLSFPLFVRGVDPHGKTFKELVTALNVSAGGILALASRGFSPTRHLQIELPVGILGREARAAIRELEVEVVRREHHSRSQLVALKFHRPIA